MNFVITLTWELLIPGVEFDLIWLTGLHIAVALAVSTSRRGAVPLHSCRALRSGLSLTKNRNGLPGGTMQVVDTLPERIHLHSLTSLRFYAALLVLLFHMAKIFDPMSWLSSVVGFGHTGVTFFFILSGFVLTWSHRSDGTRGTRSNFYLRRFARVWPLHLLGTVAAIAMAGLGVVTIVWPALPAALTLTQAWLPGDGRFAFNLVSWSLSCEAFFYLLFPFLIDFLQKRQRLLHFSVGVLLLLIVFGGVATLLFHEKAFSYLLYTMPAYRVGEFLIGMCLALGFRRGWRPQFTLFQAICLTVVVYAIAMVFTQIALGAADALPNFVTNIFLGPCFVAIIAAATAGDLRGDGGVLRSRWGRKLGEWSFALYLVHFMIFKVSESYVDQLALPVALLVVAALSVGALVLAGILYKFLERPAEKWIRSLAREKRALVPTRSVEG